MGRGPREYILNSFKYENVKCKVQNNKLKFGRHDNLTQGKFQWRRWSPPLSCQDVWIKDQGQAPGRQPGMDRPAKANPAAFGWIYLLVILEEFKTWYKDTGLQNLCITAPLF